MRDLLLAIFGLKTYVTNLQILNEQLAHQNTTLANDLNYTKHMLEEQKANSKKLYEEREEIEKKVSDQYSQLVRLENIRAAQHQKIEQLHIDNENMLNDNHALEEKINYYKSKLSSANAKYGNAMKKLAKYETQNN